MKDAKIIHLCCEIFLSLIISFMMDDSGSITTSYDCSHVAGSNSSFCKVEHDDDLKNEDNDAGTSIPSDDSTYCQIKKEDDSEEEQTKKEIKKNIGYETREDDNSDTKLVKYHEDIQKVEVRDECINPFLLVSNRDTPSTHSNEGLRLSKINNSNNCWAGEKLFEDAWSHCRTNDRDDSNKDVVKTNKLFSRNNQKMRSVDHVAILLGLMPHYSTEHMIKNGESGKSVETNSDYMNEIEHDGTEYDEASVWMKRRRRVQNKNVSPSLRTFNNSSGFRNRKNDVRALASQLDVLNIDNEGFFIPDN